MKNYLTVLMVALLLAGCANVVKVEGDQVVRNRLTVQLPDAWNKIELPGGTQPYDVWTQDGLTLDQLRFWVGVQSGQSLMVLPATNTAAGQKAPRVPTYRAGMPADELVGLFELVYSADGSIVTLSKVEPAAFADVPGVRFEFSVLRKKDEVPLRGMAWVAVRNNELFAASFIAPRLSFFDRLLPKAQRVVASARIK